MSFFKQQKGKETTSQQVKENHSDDQLKQNMIYNVTKFKELFNYPINSMLKTREIELPYYQTKATLLFVEGTVNTNTIDTHIVESLLKKPENPPQSGEFVSTVITSVLTAANAKKTNTFKEATKDLVNGNTIILFEHEQDAISVETSGFETRSVSEPTTEPAIKGPKVAFNESIASNRSLIQNQIRDHELMSEALPVGKRAPQQVSILYLKHIADDKLVEKVRKKLSDIDRDFILGLSILEQYIEERPYSLIPSTMTTERPDRAASFIQEGHIVLLMEGSPLALIVPITFWSLFQTVEDQYFRWAFGNQIRIIRIAALFIALFTPALYIAITTFHSEMLPTDLTLAIAATRERVPIPAIAELLFMQFTFEILREAGTRIPSQIGPTIGIVGALILGQAAVDANIVSPILVVVVSITGLASFTIPDISLNIAVRILSFVFILAANFMGFFGISLCSALLVAYLVSIKSFGVPFFAPFSPYSPSSRDLLQRPITKKQWIRPFSTSPEDKIRANKPKKDTNK